MAVGTAGDERGARRRARPGEGGALREEILVAAQALLDEAGDESALTLRAVAARTGVSTPAVYRHFADKDALVSAVCMRVWERLGEDIRAGLDGVDDPYQKLRRGAGAYVRFGLAHPVQYRLLMMTAPRPGRDAPEREAAEACLGAIAAATEPCVRAGVLHGDAERIALRALAGLHGCVALMIAHPYFPWPPDSDEFCDEVVRMCGLGSAALGRLQAEVGARALPAAPSTGRYLAAFDAWAEALRGG